MNTNEQYKKPSKNKTSSMKRIGPPKKEISNKNWRTEKKVSGNSSKPCKTIIKKAKSAELYLLKKVLKRISPNEGKGFNEETDGFAEPPKREEKAGKAKAGKSRARASEILESVQGSNSERTSAFQSSSYYRELA